MKKAHLVWGGGQQFVILPEGFRFGGSEVAVSRDSLTGDVVLSDTTHSWSGFDEVADVPEDFLSDRGQGEESRDPFEGWDETSVTTPPDLTTR